MYMIAGLHVYRYLSTCSQYMYMYLHVLTCTYMHALCACVCVCVCVGALASVILMISGLHRACKPLITCGQCVISDWWLWASV